MTAMEHTRFIFHCSSSILLLDQSVSQSYIGSKSKSYRFSCTCFSGVSVPFSCIQYGNCFRTHLFRGFPPSERNANGSVFNEC